MVVKVSFLCFCFCFLGRFRGSRKREGGGERGKERYGLWRLLLYILRNL